MSMLSQRKRRKIDNRSTPPLRPQPVGNRYDDAQAEADLAAQGIDMTMDAPGSMNPLEKAIADAEQLIASDPGLTCRPMERKLLLQMLTRKLMNIDGTPVKGKNGKDLPGTAWDAVVGAEILRAANGDEAARDRVWLTIHGKPRQGFELSGPGGGPISTTTKLDGMSEREIAERVSFGLRLAERIIGGGDSAEAVEMIDVSATEVTEATTTPVSLAANAALSVVEGPPSQPQPTKKHAQPVPPNTGMIPRK